MRFQSNTYTGKEIVEKIRQNQGNDVLKYLYTNYYPNIYRYVLSRGGTEEHAKDVFQDSVLTLFEVIMNNRLQSSERIGGYLMRTAKNCWIDLYRKESKMIVNHDEIPEQQENTDYLLTKEKNQLIEQVLDSIGERCKELIRMVIYQGYSMKEIAEKMQFSSENSAKSQHYKCRQKLVSKYKDSQELKAILRGEE